MIIKKFNDIEIYKSLFFLFITCFLVICFGFVFLIDYKSRPETPIIPPRNISKHVFYKNDEKTLIIFIHPHCPCSYASLYELRDALNKYKKKLNTKIICFLPRNKDNSWVYGKNYNFAKSIQNTTIILDKSGKFSKYFKVNISGHILIYDENGILKFNGGITAFRGHIGDSKSKSNLLKILLSKNSPLITMPTFGCKLYNTKH